MHVSQKNYVRFNHFDMEGNGAQIDKTYTPWDSPAHKE